MRLKAPLLAVWTLAFCAVPLCLAHGAAPTPPPPGSQNPVVTFCWDPTANAGAGAWEACPSLPLTPTPLTNSTPCTVPAGTAGVVVPPSNTRQWVMLTNRTSGTEDQDVGSSNVTVKGGIPLAPGGGFLFTGVGAKGPIYAIAPVSGPCSYVEG
jgi:hypothetical protein